jgi:hypothetical protein
MTTPIIKAHSENPVIELEDSSRQRVSANFLLDGRSEWGAEQTIGRLAKQFLKQNRGILRSFGIDAYVGYDGSDITVNLNTTTRVGALPLLSPTTGKPDYGLVIRPRYGWLGIGRMLSHTGWRVLPKLLRLPQLPRSDRKVPAWVISSVVLRRIKSLLEQITRRFEMTERDRAAPRGQVRWSEYATRRLTRAKFLDVPCRFPELSDDSRLLRAVHYTLRKHRASLSTQRGSGPMVAELLELCQLLIRQVDHVAPQPPTGTQLDRWSRRPLQPEAFSSGLQAIEWTVEDRGLAGLGDREGLAWMLPMEEFFEGWLELLAERYASKFGGRVRRGRKHETVVPISWDPPWVGSQRALIPDVVIEQDDRTVILDAKYKSHWEDLNLRGWRSVRDYVRKHHRNDILQVLAYANIPDTQRVTTCLVYPCTPETYGSLEARDRHAHRATLAVGTRQLDVVLSAIPMDGDADGGIPGLAA